jgi:hypothetical protein
MKSHRHPWSWTWWLLAFLGVGLAFYIAHLALPTFRNPFRPEREKTFHWMRAIEPHRSGRIVLNDYDDLMRAPKFPHAWDQKPLEFDIVIDSPGVPLSFDFNGAKRVESESGGEWYPVNHQAHFWPPLPHPGWEHSHLRVLSCNWPGGLEIHMYPDGETTACVDIQVIARLRQSP